MSPAPLVVGFGENSIDEIIRLPVWPEPGGTTAKLPISSRSLVPGGQVATTLATCAALGRRTKYLGTFGGDDHGRRIRAALAARGVDVGSTLRRDGPNRFAAILVDTSRGERVVLWERDPRLDVRIDEIDPAWIAGAALVHVDGTDEGAAIALATMGRAAGVPVTSDIDHVTPRTPSLMAAVTVPIFAAHVPAALTGEADPARALRALRQRHDGLLVVTLGGHGAMLLDGDTLHHAPAGAVDVVDTTGAGDVFRGAFIHALLRGDGPRDILRFANAAAAVSCTRAGALDSVPTPAEIEALMEPRRT